MQEATSDVARIPTKHLLHDSCLPEKNGHLWREGLNWMCHSLSTTPTIVIPGMEYPSELWFGGRTTAEIKSFLRLVVYDTKRSKQSEEQGRESLFLCPALNYPLGTCRVRSLATATVVIRRDVCHERPVEFYPTK